MQQQSVKQNDYSSLSYIISSRIHVDVNTQCVVENINVQCKVTTSPICCMVNLVQNVEVIKK